MTKTCTKCGDTKDCSEFTKQASNKTGYRSRCKVCSRQDYKKYAAENREKIAKGNREWFQRNKVVELEKRRQYKKDNQAYFNAHEAKRRGQKKAQTPEMSETEKFMIDGLYLIASVLSRSCGESFHIDHIQPISKGGLHTFENLQILSAEENLRKGAKYEA